MEFTFYLPHIFYTSCGSWVSNKLISKQLQKTTYRSSMFDQLWPITLSNTTCTTLYGKVPTQQVCTLSHPWLRGNLCHTSSQKLRQFDHWLMLNLWQGHFPTKQQYSCIILYISCGNTAWPSYWFSSKSTKWAVNVQSFLWLSRSCLNKGTLEQIFIPQGG